MKRTLLTLLAALALLPALADEGMWLPSLISERIDDMRAKGFRLTAEDIYSINKASMKDAVVLFNGGCTGELISPEGLLLTNHHCGYDAIQKHSTVEHDYLTNGFWAMSRAEELPNEKLWVRFLVRMEEVTDRIAAGETAAQIVEKPRPKARAKSLGRTDVLRQPAVPVRPRAVRRRAPGGRAALVDRHDTFQPFDKAGVYGIPEWIGYAAIECIEGSFYNVMGLPVQKVYTELDKF